MYGLSLFGTWKNSDCTFVVTLLSGLVIPFSGPMKVHFVWEFVDWTVVSNCELCSNQECTGDVQSHHQAQWQFHFLSTAPGYPAVWLP